MRYAEINTVSTIKSMKSDRNKKTKKSSRKKTVVLAIVAIFIASMFISIVNSQVESNLMDIYDSVENKIFEIFSDRSTCEKNVNTDFDSKDTVYDSDCMKGEDECRMYAAISDDLPDGILQDHLINEPNSLKNLAATVHIDGWGIGYYPNYGDTATIERGAERAYTDTDYDNVVNQINISEPKITLAHIRNCQAGCCCHGCETIDDPHPFVRTKNDKTWTFIHNGLVHEAIVLPLLGDYLVDNPLNCSGVCEDDQHCDSEMYFLLLLKHIENCSWHVVNGIVEALNELIDAGETGGLNFVFSDGETLWAFRRHQLSYHTLYYVFDESDGYSAVASDYPSGSQGDWVAMSDYELVVLPGDSDPVVINVLDYDPVARLVDSEFVDSNDSVDLRANATGQDWYESRNDDSTLLTLNIPDVGGNSGKKAKFNESTTGSAYLTQEFSTPQSDTFTTQWDIYIDTIADTSAPDRAGWMLIGDNTDPTRPGPNSDDPERFVYMTFFKDGGGTNGTMDLVARDVDDGWTAFTTVATGLNLKEWHTIKVVLNLTTDTYDVYVNGAFKATITARHTKTSVTHISFAQWNDGAGTFYIDNVFAPAEDRYKLKININGNGTVNINPGESTYANDTVVELTAIADPGWSFSHWSGDLGGDANPETILMDSDKVVTAIFNNISYQWEVTLNLTEPGGANDNVFFGEATDASDDLDSYDVPKAGSPPPKPYLYTWFDAGLPEPYDILWIDYRKYPDNYKVWNLAVQWVPSDYISATNITISWNNSNLGDYSEYASVILKNMSSGETVNMLTYKNYTFTASALTLHAFQIICSTAPSEYKYSIPVYEKWNLISLPVNHSIHKNDITVNYGGVNYTWQQAVDGSIILDFISAWNANIQSYISIDVLVPGKGYWIYAYGNCNLWITSNTSNDDDFITNLYEEWNLVGLPYNTPIGKEHLIVYYNGTDYTWQQAVENGTVLDFIYRWDTTNHIYMLTDTLDPGRGFWIYAYYDCILNREVD